MRRKDREITDRLKIESIIKNTHICSLGMNDNGEIYVIALNFGYKFDDEKLYLYFHSAKTGRKISIMTKSPKVGFEMHSNTSLMIGETACKYSYTYESVVGNGIINFINDDEKKAEILELIMRHETDKEFKFSSEMLQNVAVFELVVQNFSCKVHK
ncbi:pyridoxamine 5'-phosphate oxidase family protein [Campylobacter geochelonis]|uniref:Predicted flavin-nucleotide-binding protein n=1 Tax=Campylobacter geochelonis TaxID=1780362 RepID=A0A128EII9_9BACT|nr:pyridoxamine 5'-phosphate oxidase family protein [Campylobacter geochelonis]QKF70793.1 nitroimidazol reductase (NimA) family protein [Campylobacter geochelonis]CZE48670.1 Predicted flavin-nucleotide-binding protein [Campylobacter geochelonis]